MNASIRSADQTTHIKIVVVSLLAAIIVVVIGISARNVDVGADNLVISKAGKAVNFSIKDVPTVR